jgi:hypothetical protein
MKFRNILITSAALLFSAASISAATSTSAHTWVSGSGSDTNPCTFASPCLTFQGALANTSAGGTITAKDAGDFGFVNIAQSVTIDGSNLGSITGPNSGINIAGAVNVVLQNLIINNVNSVSDISVNPLSGGTLIVDNCRISNTGTGGGIYFGGAGTLIVVNSRIDLPNGNVGIFINGDAAENVVVKNTVIDGGNFYVSNAGAGPVKASLQNVTIQGVGGTAAVITFSGVTEITGSVLTQNSWGVMALTGSTISVASSMITANGTGVCSVGPSPSSKVRLDNNDIYDNVTAIDNCLGIVKTSGTNKTSGTIAISPSEVSNSVTF